MVRLLGTWNSPNPSPLSAADAARGTILSITGHNAERSSPSPSRKPPATHSLAEPNRSARRLETELVMATVNGQHVMTMPALNGP